MKWPSRGKVVSAVVLCLAVAGLGWGVWARLTSAERDAGRRGGAAAVEVAAVERGTIREVRVFSGTLESPARVEVAAKVGGRIQEVAFDLSDVVEKGWVVARLDGAELASEAAAAAADLAVAEANVTEARNGYEIAERELGRVRTLQERGVSSEAQYDVVQAAALASGSRVEVSKAELMRARAAVETAQIRLGYVTVEANWTGGGKTRVVAERFVEEGDTVAPNTPLLSIVELDPLRAVLYVAERDYARLERGQAVSLTTDAYAGRVFEGRVQRVSPVFNEGSRQARVEVGVPNKDWALRPGLFVRGSATLSRVEGALLVPEAAVTRRGEEAVVFVLREGDGAGEGGGGGGLVARMVPVKVGLREGERVELLEAPGLSEGDRVVTLGQQLLDDESRVVVPEAVAAASPMEGDG